MPFTVKALQKTGPEQPFQVTEIERRDPRPDGVVIDIKAAGICHSDIHTIRNEWGEAHFPLCVGHEIAGVVEAVGKDVTRYQVGDRVMSPDYGRGEVISREVRNGKTVIRVRFDKGNTALFNTQYASLTKC